jgi:GNAT superfamily N-acetyltransferase
MLTPFDLTNLTHHNLAARIWNAASHPDYPFNERFVTYNTTPCSGERIAGRFAVHNGEPVGFVLACAMTGDLSNQLGWVSAIAVQPAFQRHGSGSALLAWAEGWLKNHNCQRIRLGGNLRPFLPGLPYPMRASLAFFEKFGYQSPARQPYEYDIARSLAEYQPAYSKPERADLAPMRPGEEALLLDFLGREYPGRWEFEVREFIKNGGRPADFLILRVEGDVQGFVRLTLEDSERPIERFYPKRLPRPWGQFGPLGVSNAVRGQGYGGYMIDAAAAHLKSLGVNGCVIDWTSLVDLYGKFGFTIYNQYISLFKGL